MTIKKSGDKWEVDVRPAGRKGKRFRRKFDKKNEALAYEKHILANFHNKEWLGTPKDKRRLSELIDIWWKKSGQFKRSSENYRKKLNLICKELNDPEASSITSPLIANWQLDRLEKGHAVNTVRRLASCLSNVFTTLIDTGDYQGGHPLRDLKQPPPKKTEMTYLTINQIKLLLEAIEHDKELRLIVEICLATGSRWKETITLNSSNLSPYRIRFTNTKTNKPRTVPITKDLYEKIYPLNGGSLFTSDPRQRLGKLFDRIGFELPKGQKVHVLRHTFASHFVMNGGNILTLKEILGHASINQTMTYAHLAPDHLKDAITLNPLNNLSPQNDHTNHY